MTRSNNSSLLIVLLIIFTFPIWIGIAGGVFGLIAGFFGACIGIIAGIFGAIFGAIGSVFGVFDWFSFPHIHIGGFRFFLVVAIIFAIVMMSRSKKKQ
jgi:hypothetical protein